MKEKFLTFILTMSLWIVLAGRFNMQVLLLGTIICSIISLIWVDNVSTLIHLKFIEKDFLIKIYYIFFVFSSHIYDVFLYAFRVSRHAFEIKPSFSPRTVTIKTSFENINSIAILANFITLTQGTLAIDLDAFNNSYFIHWIDVKGDDEVEVKKALIRKHENLIAKIFH